MTYHKTSSYLVSHISRYYSFASYAMDCYTNRRRGIRDCHRAGSACSTADQEQDVLLLQRRLCQCATQHSRLPHLPGYARRAAHNQREGNRIYGDDRLSPQLHHRRKCQVRPQELPLSRFDEGLSNFSVRCAYE